MLVDICILADNLTQLVDEINQASWDDANEMAGYEVACATGAWKI